MGATVPVSKLLTRATSAIGQGELEEAEALYQNVLSRFPANARARDGLAKLSQGRPNARPVGQADVDRIMDIFQAGHYAEALREAASLARRAPDLRALLDIRGACYRALSQPDKALLVYRKLITLWPKDAKVWRNSAAALMDMLKLQDAESSFAMAARLDPDDPLNWVGLARCRMARGQPRPAFEAISQALARHPGHAQSLNLLGQVLRELGDLETARQAHEMVLSGAPDRAQATAAHTGLGVLANATGSKPAACAHYTQAIEVMPQNIQAHLNLSRLSAYQRDDPHITELLALAQRETLPVLDRAQLHFALFHVFDQTEPGSDTAFQHLDTANRLRRGQLRYDPQTDAALFAHINQICTDLPRNDAMPGRNAPRPVFIVGLPRSGTTLTEQIVSAPAGVHGAGELPIVETAVMALLRRLRQEGRHQINPGDLGQLAETIRFELSLYAPDAAVITDKMPLNFRWVGLILAAMPEARIIHIRRDPVETCWSNFRTCYASHGNGFAYGLEDLAAYYQQYRQLMRPDHTANSKRLYDLSYQRLVDDFETQTRALLAFCEIEWSDACLHPERSTRPVLTASARQVRQPVYNGNTRGWQRYETHLTALLDGLKDTDNTPQ